MAMQVYPFGMVDEPSKKRSQSQRMQRAGEVLPEVLAKRLDADQLEQLVDHLERLKDSEDEA